MQANRSEGTKPELALGRLLWSSGLRYRKHPRDVKGRPDFCVKKYRLAIFVDGDFWHGRDWGRRKEHFRTNRDFWIRKIERNMSRDVEVTRLLEARGWRVMRFWETDIKKNPGACVAEVLRYVAEFPCKDYVPDYTPADYSEGLAAEPETAYRTPKEHT